MESIISHFLSYNSLDFYMWRYLKDIIMILKLWLMSQFFTASIQIAIWNFIKNCETRPLDLEPKLFTRL